MCGPFDRVSRLLLPILLVMSITFSQKSWPIHPYSVYIAFQRWSSSIPEGGCMRRVLPFSRPVTRPEFCPNPECPLHDRTLARTGQWFQHYGFYHSQSGGKTRRFYCKYCGRTSSSRTFSLHYWTHRKIDFCDLVVRLNSCAGYR